MADTTYAELPLLKSWIGIPVTDDSRDALLELALQTASRQVDRDTGRRFGLDAEPSARVFDTAGRLDGTVLLVDDIGDVTGLAVATGIDGVSWQPLDASTVAVLPHNAAVDAKPVTALRLPVVPVPGLVQVTARWGWPVVPKDILTATLIRATALFKRKDSPEGVLGTSEWGAVRVSRGDPDYQALIGRYTRGAVFA